MSNNRPAVLTEGDVRGINAKLSYLDDLIKSLGKGWTNAQLSALNQNQLPQVVDRLQDLLRTLDIHKRFLPENIIPLWQGQVTRIQQLQQANATPNQSNQGADLFRDQLQQALIQLSTDITKTKRNIHAGAAALDRGGEPPRPSPTIKTGTTVKAGNSFDDLVADSSEFLKNLGNPSAQASKEKSKVSGEDRPTRATVFEDPRYTQTEVRPEDPTPGATATAEPEAPASVGQVMDDLDELEIQVKEELKLAELQQERATTSTNPADAANFTAAAKETLQVVNTNLTELSKKSAGISASADNDKLIKRLNQVTEHLITVERIKQKVDKIKTPSQDSQKKTSAARASTPMPRTEEPAYINGKGFTPVDESVKERRSYIARLVQAIVKAVVKLFTSSKKDQFSSFKDSDHLSHNPSTMFKEKESSSRTEVSRENTNTSRPQPGSRGKSG